MKSLISILIISTLSFQALAQDSKEKIMETRSKEMMRVIGLNDKEQWKKFIQENFTEAFINKNMKAKVVGADSNDGTTVSEETIEANNLEAKANMFARLHSDFGDGKISSLKITGDKVEMIVDAAQLKGTFSLKFEPKKPYLIDGLGIEAGN
jgi:hypothetical protein